MPQLFPHQIEGAEVLAAREVALLADEQRVGKTAAAIRACDYVMARRVLVITKSSARAQWGREFREWGFDRTVQVVYTSADRIAADAEVVVVGDDEEVASHQGHAFKFVMRIPTRMREQIGRAHV